MSIKATDRTDRRILVIDDEPLIGEVIRSVSSDLAIECDIAENGESGLRRLAENPYALVFLDLVMPVMDGETTLKEIRRLYPDLRVIVASVHDVEETVDETLRHGASAYLLKPFTTKQIQEILNKLLPDSSAG